MRKILGSQIQEGSNREQYMTRSFGTEGHVSRMWKNNKACLVWRRKAKERDHLEELGIGGSILLKWVDLTEIGVKTVDWFSLAQDRSKCRGCCECGDEPSGSTKCREFPSQLRKHTLLQRALLKQFTYIS